MRRSVSHVLSSRRLARRGALLALAAALGGCAVGGERPEAALDVPATYQQGPRNASAALPSVVWWRGFRSPQLTALIEEALTSNLDIAAAVARVVQADAQARIAGSALLPFVDGNITTVRSGQPGGSPGNAVSATLAASYEIDFWGKNRATLRAAEQAAIATRFDRETISLSTAAAVANAYFQVLAAQDRLRAARENQAAATRVLNLIQERLNVGTASALDTAQQESVVNTQRAAIPPLEQIVRENIITLAILVGRAPASVRVTGGSMNSISIPPVTPGLPSDLIAQRPDIRSAEAALEGANANVVSARAAMLPSITLTGQGGYTSSALSTLLRPESALFSLAAGLTQPIFDGARLQGQLDLSKGRQEELLNIYRSAVINGFGDVERSLAAIRLTAQRERLQGEVVASSRRAFQISETRLREGAVDLVTVLNTQQTLFQAQDALTQARLARLQAVVSLFQALGGGWPVPRRDIADSPVRQAAVEIAR